MGDKFQELLGEGKGRLGHGFVEEGVLAEQIANQGVISALVVEIICCNLLPQTIGDVSGQHGLDGEDALCLVHIGNLLM